MHASYTRSDFVLIPIGFVFHLGMDLSAKITECQTAAELTALENLYVLNERVQEMVFERKLEIVCRVAERRIENERLGHATNLTDTWTPEQRERFLLDWNVDRPLLGTMANVDLIRASEENIHRSACGAILLQCSNEMGKAKKYNDKLVRYTLREKRRRLVQRGSWRALSSTIIW